MKALRHQCHYGKIVVGVITNSDDRVPDVLSSFGLAVSPVRYGTTMKTSTIPSQDFDIDFHCMSYDVGFEKPDRRIFMAAESVLAQMISSRDNRSESQAKAEVETWQKVYVGDEYVKDVTGAANAGWKPIILDTAEEFSHIAQLDEFPGQPLDNLFNQHPVLRVRSLQSLSAWLTDGK